MKKITDPEIINNYKNSVWTPRFFIINDVMYTPDPYDIRDFDAFKDARSFFDGVFISMLNRVFNGRKTTKNDAVEMFNTIISYFKIIIRADDESYMEQYKRDGEYREYYDRFFVEWAQIELKEFIRDYEQFLIKEDQNG